MSQPGLDGGHLVAEGSAAHRQVGGTFNVEMIEHLQHHIDDEQDMLVAYGTLLRQSENAPVCYLLDLLLEDERRHHRILIEMINQFRSSEDAVDQQPHVPWMTPKPDPQIAAATRRLLRSERSDLRRLRALRRRLKFLRRHSLNGVLVDSLILDTRKHLGYLRAIQRLV
jgi:hypothetical protein